MARPEMVADTNAAAARLQELETALGQVLRGKPEIVRLSLVALFARGHLLIEDVPGVGKTTLAQALARSVRCNFQRVQFTSDMLPSDIVGVTIYNTQGQQFEFKPGPVFTNFLVADEINRGTPKTQSALLEAMNERQVSVDGRTYTLDEPFMVVATQNPVEHQGTYPLPESQLDRFLMRLQIGYPDLASEKLILRNGAGSATEAARALLTPEDVIALQARAGQVHVEDALIDYILAIVERTRRHDALAVGVSPRGTQALYHAVQALALLEGREYALPDDVKRLVLPVCLHRVLPNMRAGYGTPPGEAIERALREIVDSTAVPI